MMFAAGYSQVWKECWHGPEMVLSGRDPFDAALELGQIAAGLNVTPFLARVTDDIS